MTLPCMVALKIKIVAHTFLPLCDNANGRLCQERLWRLVQKFCYHVNVMSHFSSILGDKSVATYFSRGKKWIKNITYVLNNLSRLKINYGS